LLFIILSKIYLGFAEIHQLRPQTSINQ